MFTQNIDVSLYMEIDILILHLHVGDLLNSTEYSEKSHFSIEILVWYAVTLVFYPWLSLEKETENLFELTNHFHYLKKVEVISTFVVPL